MYLFLFLCLLVRYCECYQAGVPCTDACKCIECKNGRSHSHGDDESTPPPSLAKSGKKKLTNGSGTHSAYPISGGSSATVSASKRKRGAPAALTKAEALAQSEADYDRSETPSSHEGDPPTISQSRSTQRDRSNALRARESHVSCEDDRHRISPPVDLISLSPATSNSSTASSTITSSIHRPTATSTRTSALPPGSRHTLVLGGVGGMSFQAQLAAHQAQMALEKGQLHSIEDPIETDSDFASNGDSLHELPNANALCTPVKQLRPTGKQSQRPNDSIDTSFSALATLVEVASPSPRLQHFRHTPHTGLLSPVSPMSASVALQTPNSKTRQRALTFNHGSSASPLPPLFSPLRHSSAASPQMSSPFQNAPSPALGNTMTHMLQHQQYALNHPSHHQVHPTPTHPSAYSSIRYLHSSTPNMTPYLSLSSHSPHLSGPSNPYLTGGDRMTRDINTPPPPPAHSNANGTIGADPQHLHTLIVS